MRVREVAQILRASGKNPSPIKFGTAEGWI
jgi:hypothetical protein